jgi:hypothetical protein
MSASDGTMGQLDKLSKKVGRMSDAMKDLRRENANLKKDNLENKKMATSAMKDCIKLRIEIQRLNTRMISNENDVRHISSKR